MSDEELKAMLTKLLRARPEQRAVVLEVLEATKDHIPEPDALDEFLKDLFG